MLFRSPLKTMAFSQADRSRQIERDDTAAMFVRECIQGFQRAIAGAVDKFDIAAEPAVMPNVERLNLLWRALVGDLDKIHRP